MANIREKSWSQRDFGLDSRLLKAIAKLGFACPTAVQERCLPIALQGKDVLVRSRTGSGKTLAFALPVLSKLLADKEHGGEGSQPNTVGAVLLAPTKELCKQIEKQVVDLIYYCRDIISVCSLSEDNTGALQFKLKRKPDIIISTPAKIVQCCQSGHLDLSNVKVLVIDEADLVLSFGYSEDITYITSQLPKIFQGLLVSATLSPQLEKFKKVVLHNPIVVKVDDNVSNDNLLQFYLESSESDKFLIVYVFIKLGLLQVLIFPHNMILWIHINIGFSRFLSMF